MVLWEAASSGCHGTLSDPLLFIPQLLISQHSGVEALHAVAGEDNEESSQKGSETELYIKEDGETGSNQELRQRVPHANR